MLFGLLENHEDTVTCMLVLHNVTAPARQRDGLPVVTPRLRERRIWRAIFRTSRALRATPNTQSTPLSSHQALIVSRQKPEFPRTRIRTCGHASRICTTRQSGTCSRHPGSRWSEKHPASRPVTPNTLSASRRSSAPPSEESRPPSKLAVTSRRPCP